MSVGFTAVGDEIVVHTTTTGGQFNPVITSFADGSSLIVWVSENVDSEQLAVVGQHFNADGSKNGGEFQVNSTETGYQIYPSVATLSSGGFVVVWGSNINGSFSDIYGQKYHANGTANGGEFLINTNTTDEQTKASVTGLSDGGFVVTWMSDYEEPGSGLIKTVQGQKYDSNGATSGVEFSVGVNTIIADFSPVVKSFDDGGFIIAYNSHSATLNYNEVFAQIFDAAGVAVGPEFQVNTTVVENQWYPAVTTFADGSFIIAWSSEAGDHATSDVHMQRYDAAGVKDGTETLVNTAIDYDQREVDITTLADGGFVVVWSGDVNTTSHFNIYAQRYDANGDTVGVETQINTFTVNYQFEPVVEGLADGGFIISWHSNTQDAGGFGVYAQKFAAELWGTSGKDNIRDNGGANWIDGQGGNDTLRGKTGKDTIFGGDGKDKIYGGDKADALFGGKGRDTISGGNGNDKIKGGGGSDSIYGGIGKDIMTGGTGNDTFVFLDASDSKVGKMDVIKDFGNGEDRIDLMFTGLNYSSFLGEGVLSGDAGEIVTEVSGSNLIVHIDINGNGVSDMDILVKNTAFLTEFDFLLDFVI